MTDDVKEAVKEKVSEAASVQENTPTTDKE